MRVWVLTNKFSYVMGVYRDFPSAIADWSWVEEPPGEWLAQSLSFWLSQNGWKCVERELR